MGPPQSGYSSTDIWIELEFGNVGFSGEGETGVHGEKNFSEQRREPTPNSTHILRRVRESIPSHIGGRRVLSPLRGLSPLHYISCPLGKEIFSWFMQWCFKGSLKLAERRTLYGFVYISSSLGFYSGYQPKCLLWRGTVKLSCNQKKNDTKMNKLELTKLLHALHAK